MIMKIPDTFVQVVTKLHDEVDTISIRDVIVINKPILNPANFELIDAGEKFRVEISLQLKQGLHPKTDKYSYTESINNLWKYTYSSEYEFVDFDVIAIDTLILTNREKFAILFGG